MKAMILAAGEGTRLRPHTLKTPKPLLPIGGIPLIEHTLNWLKSHGITEVVINLYYLGELIKDYLDDGSWIGMKIIYSEEETLMGTSGGVKQVEDFFDEPFVVFYGDNLTDFNLSEMIELHRKKKASITVALFEPTNPAEYGIVKMNEANQILGFIEKPQTPILNLKPPLLANAGVYILENSILSYVPKTGFSDFGYDIFPKLITAGVPIIGYPLKPNDYFLDTGTIEKYEQANRDVENGWIRAQNLGLNPKHRIRNVECRASNTAVFLDRDGTIAEDVNYCSRVEDFNVLPTVPEAIKLINENGFKVVLITNQSGITRGYFTEETLAQIHSKMESKLAKHGAKVDAVYYCPHHPNDGCDCRKPRTALLTRAVEELGIDLKSSYMIGDVQKDIDAGRAAGCKTVLVTTGPSGGSGVINADYTAENLLKAAAWIVENAGSQ